MVYTYECSNCKKIFDLRRKLSEANKDSKCPDCDSPSIKIPSFSGNIFFSGPGFYINDKNK